MWAHLGSNQGLLACKASALPLSYAPGAAAHGCACGTADSIRSGGRPRRAGGTCQRGRLGSNPVLDR